MGIKILFEHGKIGGNNPSHGVKVIAINQDNNNYCDVINAFPYLSRLSKKNLNDLFNTLEFMVTSVMQGTVSPKKGTQYIEPISAIIRQQYKEHFKDD